MVVTRARNRAARIKAEEGPFRILDLPPELVELVFEQLAERSPHTLLDARRACRTFQAHSIVAFGTTYFEHVDAMLHPLSLTVLLEIATHCQLSKFVRNVTISGERIGGIVDLSGQDDEQKLKDLQTSMEQSGLDHLVLSDVFRKLPNLKTVRIDNDSFFFDDETVAAARCGRKYIVAENTVRELDYDEYGFNRAFGVVFSCLRKAGLAGKVDINIQANITDQALQYHDFFDPTSDDWNKYFGTRVKSIKLSRNLSSSWSLDLLKSVPNLQKLDIFIAEGILQFSHPDTGLFLWPDLQHLELDDASCPAHTIIDFLDAHRGTIRILRLQGLELIDGSWRQPLQIIRSMPELEYM